MYDEYKRPAPEGYKGNNNALLVYRYGEVNPKACDHCLPSLSDNQAFPHCVSMINLYHGKCANCIANGWLTGMNCSLVDGGKVPLMYYFLLRLTMKFTVHTTPYDQYSHRPLEAATAEDLITAILTRGENKTARSTSAKP
jgi:Protein of unknown function (DUF3716)